MYRFNAHYINMDNDETRTQEIYFSEQFFKSEKECYIHAMSIAYDGAAKNECLVNVEFISC